MPKSKTENEETTDESTKVDAKVESAKAEKNKAKSESVKAKEENDKELEALQKGDFKFIDSKDELQHLAAFFKNAKIADGVQMSSRDKQKANVAASNWYAKAKKTLGAS